MEKQFNSDAKLTLLKIEGNAASGAITFSGSFFNTVNSSISTQKVYDDFLLWLDDYSQNPKKTTMVNFTIFYADTPSTLFLTKVCERLSQVSAKSNLHATWHYNPEDEAIFDLGLDLKVATSIELEFNNIN